MFKPKTTVLAATALAIGVLGAAAPLAQAGKLPNQHPEGISVPRQHPERHPDAKRNIIGVLRLRAASFEPNAAFPPGPTAA